LAQVLTSDPAMVGHALRRYARLRHERVARVQRKALENGEIFHATGLKRWGRDIAMQVLGSRLLDQPWLYGERLVGHAAQ
jgi:salicylate hydroxylase